MKKAQTFGRKSDRNGLNLELCQDDEHLSPFPEPGPVTRGNFNHCSLSELLSHAIDKTFAAFAPGLQARQDMEH
jgi:hypothetical protein